MNKIKGFYNQGEKRLEFINKDTNRVATVATQQTGDGFTSVFLEVSEYDSADAERKIHAVHTWTGYNIPYITVMERVQEVLTADLETITNV